jgi:putative flippase GtrA
LLRGGVPLAQLRAAVGRDGPRESLLRQASRFAVIGVLSTVAYLLLFLAMRAPLGAQAANLVALLVTAVANTAVNRRFTFGVRGGAALRHQAQGLVVFALGLALTSGALAVLSALSSHPARLAEISVLVAANLAATVLRFVLLREWVFAGRAALPPASTPTSEASR